jgi:hypothetical protein
MSYDTNPYILMTRACREINTDPQRRCYNGAHFSSELVWTEWEALDRLATQAEADRKVKFWTELNEYAVGQRGASAKREFKIEQLQEVEA